MIARWLLPLSLPLAVKAALAVLLLAASQFHLWNRLSSGSVFAPEFPRAVVLALNGAFGAIALLAVLQIALDLGALAAALVQRGSVAIPDGVRFAAAGLAVVLAGIGVAQAARVPPVVEREVVIPGLPPAFEGYRLLQLTDLHLSRLFPAAWARAVVARANAAGADAIVVTGDFIDGSVAMPGRRGAARRASRPGRRLRHSRQPRIFLRLPRLDGPSRRPRPADAAERPRGARPGRGRPGARRRHRRFGAQRRPAGPDLAAALKGAPPGAPILLLDHQPRNARQAAARGVAFQLSGHTHGGMIRGLDRLVARGNDGFVSGAYAVGGMTLFVGNGTGIWPGFALRLGRDSEMTRFVLRGGG